MSSTRSLWFESHLLSDRAGRRAREACERLGHAVHEVILADGDRIAAVSPTIAQQYYKTAAGVWEALGDDGFRSWFELGYGLLAAPHTPRDAAAAYYALTPKVVAAVGLQRLGDWCGLGNQIAKASRKLGSTFFSTTAALVERLPQSTLHVWASEGLRLHRGSGWRGEFLAQAYFAAAPQVLSVLTVDEIALWARLAAQLQSTAAERSCFESLPAGLAALKPSERQAFFAVTLAAAVHPAAAASIYRVLPGAVRRVHGAARLKVLQVLQATASVSAAAVAEIAPVIGALVHDLPAAHRAAALDLATAVVEAFPRGGVALLRSLPMAYEDARHEAIVHWVERGLSIAADNAEAGEAYFALESRTSEKILHASSTAVTLSDAQGLLRKLIQMLSGQPAAIRSSELLHLRAPLEEQPQENEVELPLRVDIFPTHEDNLRVYRFIAAQIAGRREHGTYAATLADGSSGSLYDFLYNQEQPPLLAEWFLLADGFRVATAQGRTYRGLAREQRELAAQLVVRWAQASGRVRPSLFDLLLAWLLSGLDLSRLPEEMRVIARVTAAVVVPLASPGATVNDALRIAQLLVSQLAEHTDAVGEPSGGIMSDQMTGDALIAAYLYDEDDQAPMPQGESSGEADGPSPPPPVDGPQELQLEVDDALDDQQGANAPLSAEALQQLIEAGVELNLKQGRGDEIDGLGLYITDLLGKIPTEQLQELRSLLDDATRGDKPPPRRWLERQSQGTAFYYDEWDYHITDYRRRWCRLLEVPLQGDSGEFFHATLTDYAAMIPEVRRQFQKIRPEMYRIVRGLEDGEDFDLNAVVSARVDQRAKRSPSSKLYTARQREERDVATLFLIDMSASTDEPMQKPPPGDSGDDADPIRRAGGHGPSRPGRRIIDVTKEALVIMSEALEEIGDAYAVYGFSGHGRSNVEFYLVKSFNESLSAAVKGRIGAIEPKRSTRMGTALRHAMEKMAGVTARSRHLILLSDGFPQDFDYGQDRRSNIYGLRDTSVALRECEAAGITPFCITVDKAGHDYLREMCPESRYLVIDDISSLPRELPKIYQRVVGS